MCASTVSLSTVRKYITSIFQTHDPCNFRTCISYTKTYMLGVGTITAYILIIVILTLKHLIKCPIAERKMKIHTCNQASNLIY